MRRPSLSRILPFVALLLIAGTATTRAQSVILSETTRVTLMSSSSAVAAGQPLTLTASITTPQGGAVPGGKVQFIDLNSLTVLGWADATRPTIEVGDLLPGRHAIRADYSGTDAFLPLVVQPSQSEALQVMVQAVPQLAVMSSHNPSRAGEVVTLTVRVSAAGAMPRGSVTFRTGDTVLAAGVALDGLGVATFCTSALPEGVNAIEVDYAGDDEHAASSSSPLDQAVTPFVVRDTSLLSRQGE